MNLIESLILPPSFINQDCPKACGTYFCTHHIITLLFTGHNLNYLNSSGTNIYRCLEFGYKIEEKELKYNGCQRLGRYLEKLSEKIQLRSRLS